MDRWGISAPLRRMTGGNRNKVFRTYGLEKDWVFKTTRRTESAIRWLENVHNNAEMSGLIVPKLKPSFSGAYIQGGWTIEPFMHGKAATPNELLQTQLRIKSFHEQCLDIPQRPGFCGALDLLEGGQHTDFDMAELPTRLTTECLQAWGVLNDMPQSVVHGDLNCSNVLIAPCGAPVLLDWDETRKDACVFDLAAISHRAGISPSVNRALDAWEMACSWKIEPDYAAKLASKFLGGASAL